MWQVRLAINFRDKKKLLKDHEIKRLKGTEHEAMVSKGFQRLFGADFQFI
jgi:hypothetical protein